MPKRKMTLDPELAAEGDVVSRREKTGDYRRPSDRVAGTHRVNVLDDQELLGRLFELRFTAMDLGLSDLVVRRRTQAIFWPAPQTVAGSFCSCVSGSSLSTISRTLSGIACVPTP